MSLVISLVVYYYLNNSFVEYWFVFILHLIGTIFMSYVVLGRIWLQPSQRDMWL